MQAIQSSQSEALYKLCKAFACKNFVFARNAMQHQFVTQTKGFGNETTRTGATDTKCVSLLVSYKANKVCK
ncbi:hypothetical protein EON73_00450 [bacterium]|nr:MAG: hypothetical protein EON73_00450 [bacterium]